MMLKTTRKRTNLSLLLFAFVMCSFTAIQAQKTVNGTVLDETGTPLPGASIVEKGTSNGTSTDFDGIFSLNVNDNSTTLVISFIGYTTKEIAIANNVTVSLEPDASVLDEVVVVGYGTVKKIDVQNAVSTANIAKAVLTPTSDVTEMLRGRVAGLQVEVGGGTLRPGGNSEVIFRGRGSIEGNTKAIYVVDGIIRQGGIEDINSDDIKSIEVLKDASAQAIYGSRGVNGVILVTTKRGTSGKINVSYHGYVTGKRIERNFDVYSGQEYAQLVREARRSDIASDEYAKDEDIFSEVELDNIANNRFVNFEDELIRDGMVNSQSINLSAGTDFTKVYASLNYFKEDGIIPTSGYTRKNLRLNLDQKINDKFSVNFDFNLLNDDIKRAANVNLITISPLGSAYDEDGNVTRYPSGEELSAVNPIWNLREQSNDEKGNDFVINITPSYKITNDLTYQLKTNFTRKNSERGQYQSSLSSSGDKDRGIARIDNQLREAYLVENILTFDKELNENNKLNVTLVQAIDENRYTRTFTEAKGFDNESLGYNGVSNAVGSVNVIRDQNTIRTASFMARARYSLYDKYLFSATYRGDGASVNAEGNKWIQNPAASFAWKIHNEDFLKNVTAIQELKFRASYGSLANALSRPYQSLFLAERAIYIFNGGSVSGFSPSKTLPNPNLKYERVTTLNLGLDFSLFKNFLTGAFEYYDSRTNNLLLKRPVNPTTGYDFTYFNAGELQNSGLELSLTANLINTTNFNWSVSTNWSNNKSEILELYEDGDGNQITSDDVYNYYVGQPNGVIYQYEFDGIWQEGDDIANAPQANPGSINEQKKLRPGDIRIKDINNDGKITQEDRVFTNPNPDWFGSLSSSVNYKGFDLFVDFYAVQGATKSNPFLGTNFNNGGTLQGKRNGVKVPYYTPENPSTTFPRPNYTNPPTYLNSLAVKDASYIRLRTLSVGYSLQDSALSMLNMDSMRFYVTATNLFTKTDYIGYSPEINIRDTFPDRENQDTGYPDTKSVTFGVKVSL